MRRQTAQRRSAAHAARSPRTRHLRGNGQTLRKVKKNPRKNSNIKIASIFILLFVIVVGASAALSSYAPPKAKGDVILTIEEGSTTASIAKLLEEEEVIRSASSFEFYSKLFSDSSKFKAGIYKISRPVKLKDLTALLIKGTNVADGIKVTIPEGYVVTQVASLLQEKGLGDKAGFLALCAEGNFDYEFLQFQKPASMRYKLEGFLYPSTYYFFEGTTNEEILKTILDEFNKDVWKELKQGAQGRNASPLQILTLASIVEKEAVVDQERALIAGVFSNRLGINMALQSCATVQYALGREKFATTVTIAETQTDNPYNTYKYPGLTPGPICNPGLASIRAAIAPQASSYLYFVAKGDGSHQFSVTYEEHLKAIQQYQK